MKPNRSVGFCFALMLSASVQSNPKPTLKSAMAVQDHQPYPWANPFGLQQRIEKLQLIIGRFAADPEIYKAREDLAAILLRQNADDSLRQANDQLERVDDPNGQPNPGKIDFAKFYIRFQIDEARYHSFRNLDRASRLAHTLENWAKASDDRAELINAWVAQAQIEHEKGNAVPAAKFLLEKLKVTQSWNDYAAHLANKPTRSEEYQYALETLRGEINAIKVQTEGTAISDLINNMDLDSALNPPDFGGPL